MMASHPEWPAGPATWADAPRCLASTGDGRRDVAGSAGNEASSVATRDDATEDAMSSSTPLPC